MDPPDNLLFETNQFSLSSLMSLVSVPASNETLFFLSNSTKFGIWMSDLKKREKNLGKWIKDLICD